MMKGLGTDTRGEGVSGPKMDKGDKDVYGIDKGYDG
jgi:hypothetical protein